MAQAKQPENQHIVHSRPKAADPADDDEKKSDAAGALDNVTMKWLDHYSLAKYADALYAEGLESIKDARDLDEDEIVDLIADAGLPKLKGKRLKKAILAVQSGKYVVNEELMA